MPRAKKEKVTYTCMCCLQEKTEDKFYKSQYTKVWNFSDRKVLFCRECLDRLMNEYTNRYGEEMALKICCALLDVPFYAETYRSIIENNSVFSIGMYTRILNGSQFRNKCFANCIIENQLSKTENEIKEIQQSKWSRNDTQNMKFVLSVVGYDPFDNCGMTQDDRKYCFNILASYCDSDGIREDGHKIQSVVQMTQLQLQCRKLDELVNQELLGSNPDDKRVKALTDTKAKLIESISKIAKDNNLSAAYNKHSSAGASTLSRKMKEIADDGYEAIKVNLFDIKTCGAIKQVADISNQSILDQLALGDNDYTHMLAEQREMIEKFRNLSEEYEEENRMLKNKLADLEHSKKSR